MTAWAGVRGRTVIAAALAATLALGAVSYVGGGRTATEGDGLDAVTYSAAWTAAEVRAVIEYGPVGASRTDHGAVSGWTRTVRRERGFVALLVVVPRYAGTITCRVVVSGRSYESSSAVGESPRSCHVAGPVTGR